MNNLYRMREFLDLDLGDDAWHISNLLRPQGKLLLFGEPKIGKSNLALDMSICLEQGTPVWGIPRFLPMRGLAVLYIQTEVGEQTLQGRLKAMLSNYPDASDGSVWLYTVSTLYIDQDEQARTTFEALLNQTLPDVVILDPLADIYMGRENEADDAKKLTSYLNRLMDARKFSTIIIHHMSKPGEGKARGQSAARGSSVFTGWANANVAVTHGGMKDGKVSLRMSFDLRDAPPLESIMVVRDSTSLLHSVYTHVVAKDEHLGVLLELLKDSPLTKADLSRMLAEQLQVAKRTAYRIIDGALDNHQIYLDGDLLALAPVS